MTALLDTFKDNLDGALASAQAEVGTFLQQKIRILNLPQSVTKQNLLNDNASLQSRATSLVGQGTALKERLGAFNAMDFGSYGKIPGMIKDGTATAQGLLKVREDMARHRGDVDKAAGVAQPMPDAVTGAVGNGTGGKIAAAVLLGGAAWAAWRAYKGRKMPDPVGSLVGAWRDVL